MLASPGALAVPAAASVVPVEALTGAVAAPAAPSSPAVAPVPCPKAKPPAGIQRPSRPKSPPADPVERAVGGAALATSGLVVPAGAPRPPALTATTWLVADLDSGEVLGGCGPHEYATPASVQKLLLAATHIAKLDPNQVVKITRGDLDIEPGSSAVGLLQGGKYSIETLWLGLLLNSGNDAANALARLGGGSAGLAGGIQAMNAEAARLGAYQTHAVTASGLDGKGQFTSAYDLALIARVCFANANFRRYALTRQTKIPAQPPRDPRGFQIQNENDLVYEYPGALGGKTGYTDLARHSYVGAAERNGRRLVVTLLGAESRPLRGWQQGAALLDWGFRLPAGASVGTLVTPEEVAAAEAELVPEPTRPAAAGGAAVPAAADSSGDRWPFGLAPGTAIAVGAASAGLLFALPFVLLFTRRRRPGRHASS